MTITATASGKSFTVHGIDADTAAKLAADSGMAGMPLARKDGGFTFAGKYEDAVRQALAGSPPVRERNGQRERLSIRRDQALPATIDVDGTARPTTNSDGAPIHATEEGVRNFWRWFGDSKVVDGQGRPLVVYHGTPDGRGVLDAEGAFRDRFGSQDDASFFFTDSRRVARTYADSSRAFDYQSARATVGEVYLKIESPWERDADGLSWGERGGPRTQDEQTAEARREGRDGMIIRNTIDTYGVDDIKIASTVYVVFEPTQIKSAAAGELIDTYDRSRIEGSGPNSGAFDPADPRIRFSIAPDLANKDVTVVAVRAAPMGSSFAERRLKARMFAQREFGGKQYRNADTGRDVLVSRSSVTHSLDNLGRSADDLAATVSIPDLLKHAVLYRTTEGRDGDIAKHDFYAAARLQNGELRRVKIVVREQKDGLLHYSQHVVEPNIPVFEGVPPAAKVGHDFTTSHGRPEAVIKLGDLLSGVNPERRAVAQQQSPAFDERALAGIETQLRERLQTLGLDGRIALRVVDGIRSAITGERLSGVDGSYYQRLVQIAMQAPDTAWTLNHEVIHALRDLGLFKPSEWTALEKAARADTARMAEIRERYRDQELSESELIEEAIADMFADWHGGRQQQRGFIRTAFERARDFIRALYSALSGNGFTTENSVFRAIERGDVAARGGVQAGADARPRRQQRRDGDGDTDAEAAANILFELQDVDELFRYPVSKAHTPGEALRDMDPTITEVGDTADLADRDGYPFDHRLLFRTAAGADFFVYENDGEVWIDVSALQEGEGGSAIYAAIADYAFNRKKQFIGDPAGLSDVALRRRTDAMLSSAIKHGTTDHIAPHPRQLEGSEALGIPPLRWRAGDTVGNVSRMIEVSIASTLQAVPDIGDARYDFDSGTFRTGEGQQIADESLELWGRRARRAGTPGIGRQTLKRSILLSTLVRGTSEERSRLLERVLYQPDQLVSGQARRTFYNIQRLANPKPLLSAEPDQNILEALTDENRSAFERLRAATSMSAVRASYESWRLYWQDRFLPLLKAQLKVEARLGRKLDDATNVYQGEEVMTGRIGSRLDRLGDDMVSPLMEDMAARGATLDELEAFLYARHAPERNAQISRINPDFAAGTGSGMTDAEAAAIMQAVDASGRRADMEALAARVDAILEFALQTRVDAGLLSADEARAWREAYDYYVPLRGGEDMDASGDARPRSGSGINVRGGESRRAFGRESRASDILAHVVAQAQEAIQRAEVNRVGQRLLNMAQAAPDADFWTVNKVRRVPYLDSATGQVRYRSESRIAAEDADFTVSLKVDGQEHRITFNRNNKAAVQLATAMRNLRAEDVGVVMRALGAFNRYQSTINTALSPEFVVTNALRDLQMAGVVLSQHEKAGLVSGMLRDWKPALKGAYAAVRNPHAKGEWADWYRRFNAAGGRVYYNQIDDIAAIRKRIDGLLQPKGKMQLLSLGKNAMKLIEDTNLAVENAVRLSAFKNAIEHGFSEEKAASIAKNLTVNFNRRGTAGPVMNAAYLFFNASVQGSGTLILAMSRSRRVRRIVGGLVLLGFAIEMLNAAISDDDDDGESRWDKISAFDKGRNLIVMLPDGKEHIKIPLGYGLNAFYAMGAAASEITRGKSAMESGSNFISTALDAFNPVGDNGSILNLLAPTVLDPVVDLVRNRDFADRPIMPEQSQYGPPTPDNQRHWPNVGAHWKAVTDFLNAATGGDHVRPGTIDISPETLEYLFGYATGAAGTFVDRLIGMPAKAMDGELTVSDVPFVRRLVGREPTWYAKSTFYERANAVEQAWSQRKAYIESGDKARLDRFMDEKADVVRMRAAAQSTRNSLADIRRRRDWLRQNDKDDREAMDSLKQREREVITRFNRRWNETVGRADGMKVPEAA